MSSRGGFPHPLSPPRARLPARRPRALARGHLRGRETQRDRERARPPPSSRRPPPRRAIRTGLPESEPAAATATALTAANRHRGARRERRGGMSEAGEATTGARRAARGEPRRRRSPRARPGLISPRGKRGRGEESSRHQSPWHCQMVQRQKWIWIYKPKRHQRRCVCTPDCHQEE